jgi:hypothetical protein
MLIGLSGLLYAVSRNTITDSLKDKDAELELPLVSNTITEAFKDKETELRIVEKLPLRIRSTAEGEVEIYDEYSKALWKSH